MADKRPSFISACKEFFGFKPGQKLSDFAAEIKALSPSDKAEIAQGLRDAGFDCEDPVVQAV